MNWSNAEEWILYILQRRVKNKWAEFVNCLYGRSDNAIKNYWNTALSHKIDKFDAALENYYGQIKSQTNMVADPEAHRNEVEKNLLSHYVEEARN